MRWIKWAGVASALLLIVSCFLTWVVVPSKGIVISGVSAEGTSFGKPGYLHLVLSCLFLLFSLIPAIWAKRANVPTAAVNIAWAIRNYFVITACREGDCPEKHVAIYLVLLTSVLLLVAALFPDIKLPQERNPAE